jgi:type I restriction enzyme S subunit
MGYACILPQGYEVCLTQRLMLLRSDEEFVAIEYLLHYLNSPVFHEQVSEKCRGMTVPHIRVQDAPQFLVPLPPLEMQRRIVAYLNSLKAKVDRLKAQQAQTRAELGALLPSILDRAFKGEL